jgi:hypothetical protein
LFCFVLFVLLFVWFCRYYYYYYIISIELNTNWNSKLKSQLFQSKFGTESDLDPIENSEFTEYESKWWKARTKTLCTNNDNDDSHASCESNGTGGVVSHSHNAIIANDSDKKNENESDEFLRQTDEVLTALDASRAVGGVVERKTKLLLIECLRYCQCTFTFRSILLVLLFFYEKKKSV